VIRGANLGEAGFIDDGFVYVSLEKAATLSLNQALPGDVVFTQRGTIGQVAMIPLRPRFERYIISQSQMKLTPDLERIEPRYLVHYFRSPSALRLLKQNTLATGVPHINLTILRRIPVPMPSLAEQQRIADLLDKAETIRRKRQEAIALTDDLLRSTFLEMFGDLSQWPTRPFAELVSESLLGLVRAAAEQGPDRAHPYVRMNAIRPDGALDLTNLTRVDASGRRGGTISSLRWRLPLQHSQFPRAGRQVRRLSSRRRRTDRFQQQHPAHPIFTRRPPGLRVVVLADGDGDP
jgi:hypothetical protein